MSIQDIGAIGELIGALAVVVTLVYLAVQTRQARVAAQETAKFARLSATDSVVAAYARWRTILVSNSEVVVAINKANNAEELTDVEKVKVAAALEELFIAAMFAYVSSEFSGSIQPISTDVEYVIDYFQKNPGAIEQWAQSKRMIGRISPNFVAAVEREIERLGMMPNKAFNIDA